MKIPQPFVIRTNKEINFKLTQMCLVVTNVIKKKIRH